MDIASSSDARGPVFEPWPLRFEKYHFFTPKPKGSLRSHPRISELSVRGSVKQKQGKNAFQSTGFLCYLRSLFPSFSVASCFPAFLLLLVSLPFKLICCLSQFVASSKVVLFKDSVKVFWCVLYVLPFVGTICLCCILNIKS